METFDAIRGRRSVRRFSARSVSDELIERIVEAGTWAPSAHNAQPWEFIVTKDPEKKAQLSRRRWATFIESAAAAIIVCGHYSATSPERKKTLVIESCSAAIQNMLLAAYDLGVGSCWVADFDEALVRSLFSIPEGYTPVAVLAIGYPQHAPASGGYRRPLSEVLHYESFELKGRS